LVAKRGGFAAFSPTSSKVNVIAWISRASGNAAITAGEYEYCEPKIAEETVCQRGIT